MNATRQFIIDIVGMFPGDGRRLRRRTVADGVSELAATLLPPMIVARLRETTVSPHEVARVVRQASEPAMSLQPLGDLWFGTGFLRFRFGVPILPGFAFILRSNCRETCLFRQLIEVLGELAAQRALCRGRSETKS
jgi:hypothetical protein